MSKRASSVQALVRTVSSTKKFRKKMEREIQKKSLAKFLFALRCEHKLTQKQLAEKIRCSQSRISKIESSYDEELKIKDLLDYARALNLQLELGYRSPSVRIVDLIKYHAFKIKNYLETLVNLVQKDKALDESIGQFHDEVLYNMIKFISDSVSKLNYAKKKSYPGKKGQIHISPPLEMGDITSSSSTKEK